MGFLFFVIGVGLLLGHFGVTMGPNTPSALGMFLLPLMVFGNMEGNSLALIGGVLSIIVGVVIEGKKK